MSIQISYNDCYCYKIDLIIVKLYEMNQTQINKKTISRIQNSD